MGTSQDEILRIIREHPEGISTKEIAQQIPGNNDFTTKVGMAYMRCKRLMLWGEVVKELVPDHGKHCIAVWRAVDDS